MAGRIDVFDPVTHDGSGGRINRTELQQFNGEYRSGSDDRYDGSGITVGANLQVRQSGTFSDGGFQITGNGTGTLQVAAGSYGTDRVRSGLNNDVPYALYTTGNITLNAAEMR